MQFEIIHSLHFYSQIFSNKLSSLRQSWEQSLQPNTPSMYDLSALKVVSS